MNVPGRMRARGGGEQSTTTHEHRLITVHQRRQARDANQRGYSDGFLTAKIFAAHGLSKLGFIEQYISDSITALGSAIVPPGSEGLYHDSFLVGLRDAEAIVQKAIP
jgi:glucan 1,3-beta-glucosidase